MPRRLDMNAKKIITIADATFEDGDATNHRVFQQKRQRIREKIL